MNRKLLFGLEIECERKKRNSIRDFFKEEMKRWEFDTDGSLESGSEVEVKSPKLNDEYNSWRELKIVCEFLKNHNAVVNERTGGHIYFGENIFEKDIDSFLFFLKPTPRAMRRWTTSCRATGPASW